MATKKLSFESNAISDSKKPKVKRLSTIHKKVSRSIKSRLIAFPESKKRLIKELSSSKVLGTTIDGKTIYLTTSSSSPSTMREIGRLREKSFRAVGEGSGKLRDVDSYDHYYEYIVLWCSNDLEIVGAYRIANIASIRRTYENKPIYIESLFDIDESIDSKLSQGIELGRSFIQPKYWGKRNLDHLWTGIGAYLYAHPEVRYLIGPVSIPDHFPDKAKSLICHYYQTHFGEQDSPAIAKLPYRNSHSNPFGNQSKSDDMKLLRSELAKLNLKVPTLYKHYTDVYETGGASVLSFNIDPDFSNCLSLAALTRTITKNLIEVNNSK